MDEGEFAQKVGVLHGLKEQERSDIIQEEVDLRSMIKELQSDLELQYRKQRDHFNLHSVVRDRNDRIMEELSDLTERLKEIQVPRISRYTEYETLLDFSNRADKLFLNGTIEIRRKVVEHLFSEVMMLEGRIEVSPKIQPFTAEAPGSVEFGVQLS